MTQYLATSARIAGPCRSPQQYVGNPSGFLFPLATRYFSVTTAAVRMYDTNHLILGVKAEGQEIKPGLLEAAKPYVDVFSIEDYQLQPGYAQAVHSIFWPPYLPVQPNLADFEQYVQRPLMIGEYASIAVGPGLPAPCRGLYLTAPNQQVRASQYENFIAPLYEASPWLVGDDWFQYVDEPVNGRTGDGENSNFGMVDVNGNPYPDMVSAVQLMHSVAADQSGGSGGGACDSWAGTGSGLTCTALMLSPSSSALTIVTSTLPPGKVGTSYYFGGVYAAGGTPDYRYSVTGGTVPKGLKLDHKSGIITGTPTTSGTFSFTVQATDSAHSTPVSQVLSVTVAPKVKVSITTTTLKTAKKGAFDSQTLKATGGTVPYSWSISGGTLPTGLNLAPTGTITGVPTVSGTFAITVRVSDSSNPQESATGLFILTVK